MHDEPESDPLGQPAWIASARTESMDCLRTGIPACLGQTDTRMAMHSTACFFQAWVVGLQDAGTPRTTTLSFDVDDG
jgi:hypothetical protein